MVKRFTVLLAAVLSISACGYRGSLYIPDDPSATESPPAAPQTQSSGEPQ